MAVADRQPIERWESWVKELSEHPLDEHEYLGTLVCRDGVAEWLEVHGGEHNRNVVDEIDADFESATVESGRFAEHFSAQTGSGWWWQRVPADPDALTYLTQDW